MAANYLVNVTIQGALEKEEYEQKSAEVLSKVQQVCIDPEEVSIYFPNLLACKTECDIHYDLFSEAMIVRLLFEAKAEKKPLLDKAKLTKRIRTFLPKEKIKLEKREVSEDYQKEESVVPAVDA